MGSVSYPFTQYERFKGGGTLLINGEEVAVVEFECELKHKEFSTETTKGIYKDVSKFIDFKGKFTLLAGTHKFWTLFMGIDAMTSVEETLATATGTGAEQTITPTAQPTIPAIIKVSISSTATVTPDTIIISGKDAFGNPITEEFTYTTAETIVGNLLFSQIDSIILPATLQTTETVTISTVAGVKSGKPVNVPKFTLVGFVKGADGHIQGVQMQNVTILDKPKFDAIRGKEEHIKEEITFVVSNANEDIIFYEYIPTQ